MEIIYYNKNTGSFAEFKVGKESNESFFKIGDCPFEKGEAIVRASLEYILNFGGEVLFPLELLEKFLEDSEIDVFLCAAFDEKFLKLLKTFLYAVNPKSHPISYKSLNTADMRVYETEAINHDGAIMYSSVGTRVVAGFISKQELQEHYIQNAYVVLS